MKRTFFWLVVFAIVAAVLWPGPNPLAGVETVALFTSSAPDADLAPDVLSGFEVALGQHRIRIVSDRAQADAVIIVEPQSADLNFKLDQEGFRGSATIRCLVTKGNQQSVMFLNVTVGDNGVQAELVGRKFWEVWK